MRKLEGSVGCFPKTHNDPKIFMCLGSNGVTRKSSAPIWQLRAHTINEKWTVRPVYSTITRLTRTVQLITESIVRSINGCKRFLAKTLDTAYFTWFKNNWPWSDQAILVSSISNTTSSHPNRLLFLAYKP